MAAQQDMGLRTERRAWAGIDHRDRAVVDGNIVTSSMHFVRRPLVTATALDEEQPQDFILH